MTSDGSSHLTVHPLKVDKRVFMGLIWAGSALATICIFLRTYARIRQFNRLYIDDAFAILSLAFVIASAILWQINVQHMYDLVAVGVGLQMPGPDFADNVLAYQTALGIITIFFYSSLWSVKASFLLFIRRLGTNVTRIRHLWWLVCILTIAGYAACIGATPYNCFFVSLETIMTGCSTVFFNAHTRMITNLNSAWDVISDVLIMSVPISMLWGTRMRLKKKITLGILFSLTVITIIVAIIRNVIVNYTTGIADLSWIYVWNAIEGSISIVVLCVASIRGLFTNQDAVRPARYEPPGSSTRNLRNSKSKRNRLLHTLDSLTGVATQTTYIRAEDSGTQSGPPSVRSEEPIIPLEGVKVKQRYEVTHEHV